MTLKSIKKNYIYNLVLTTVNLIFPLITSPYLSTTLGAENLGKVNYATSIIRWFMLFAAFGIPRYGIREIAKNRDDKEKLSMTFWNLILIQLILSIVSIVVYLLMIFNMKSFNSELSLYLVMVIMIVLSIFSIDWFYQGIEEYGYITIRNIIFKLISLILIFTMVTEKENYLTYAIINVFGLSFNNILNYLHAKKYIDKKIYEFKILHYLKQLKIYFFTTLIIAIYTTLDQTLVGAYSKKDLAFYIRSKTVQGIGINITNSIVTVFIPRTAYLINKNYNQYKEVIEKSINYIYILALPCTIGIFLLSDEIMLMLGGKEFFPSAISLRIISCLVLINSIGAWQVNQILIPHKLEKLALKIQFIGSLVSLILNLILIKRYSFIGAAFTWIVTELMLVIIGAIIIRKKCINIKIRYINKSFVKYLTSGIIMSIVIIMIKIFINNSILNIIFSIVIGSIIYFLGIIIFRDRIVINMINQLKIFKRKNNS